MDVDEAVSRLLDDGDGHVDRRRRDGASEDSYANIVIRIAKEDGVQAFFTRGLSTRILANGLQSIVFSVVWRLLFDT